MTSTTQSTGPHPAHQPDNPDAPPRGGWISDPNYRPTGRHRAGRTGLIHVGVLVGLTHELTPPRRTRRTGATT